MKTHSSNQFTAIIPARFASSRFPGKPLALIGGKSMIQRVWEQTLKAVDIVYVATDDDRIFDEVQRFGGKAVMTSADHKSGTDRCAEAAVKIAAETGMKIDVILNIQGDEPFISPGQIELLKSCFSDISVKIATLIRKTLPGEDIFNPNHPKVILDRERNAIYFSRTPIPYHRGSDPSEWSELFTFNKHIGLYAYRIDTLKEITLLEISSLETAESLEQNRWLENGLKIRTAVTDQESISIDTPEDLVRAKELLKNFE